MEQRAPVFNGKATALPGQKQQENVKDLLLSEERILRALAWQRWRLSRCSHLATCERFLAGFDQLVQQQDAVAAQLQACETAKAAA